MSWFQGGSQTMLTSASLTPGTRSSWPLASSAMAGPMPQRFANPSIQDTIRRIAFDGSSRHAVFITPSIRDGLSKNNSIEGLSLVEALWARMCEGTREDGTNIEPNDPQWSKLNSIAKQSKNKPEEWLKQSEVYGDLFQKTQFANSFTYWLTELYKNGVEQTINKYISN